MSPWHLNGDSSLPSVAADGQQYKFLEWPQPFFFPTALIFRENPANVKPHLASITCWQHQQMALLWFLNSKMHFAHQHTHASALLTLNDTFYPTGTFHVATLFPSSLHLTPDFPLQLSKQCSRGFPGIRISLHFRSTSPNRNLSTYYWVFQKYLFIWLCQVIVAALEIFSLHHSIWDLSVAACELLVVTCGI